MGLTGNGPEVALFKALKNIDNLKFEKNRVVISEKSPLKDFVTAYKKIISSENGLVAQAVIEKFIAPPFGIRKGILPLIMSVAEQSLNNPVNHYFDKSFVTKVDGDPL